MADVGEHIGGVADSHQPDHEGVDCGEETGIAADDKSPAAGIDDRGVGGDRAAVVHEDPRLVGDAAGKVLGRIRAKGDVVANVATRHETAISGSLAKLHEG